MDFDSGFGRGEWRPDQRQRRGAGEAPQGPAVVDLLLQAGLWLAACLAAASTAPLPLLAPLLHDLLTLSALAASTLGLLHGERITLERFNRQDVALALLAAAQVAGLLTDPAAIEAYLQQAQLQAG